MLLSIHSVTYLVARSGSSHVIYINAPALRGVSVRFINDAEEISGNKGNKGFSA